MTARLPQVVVFFGSVAGESGKINASQATTVITREMRVIQYSRDASDETEGPRRTGYPAFAGYDEREGGDSRPLYSASSSSSLRPGMA